MIIPLMAAVVVAMVFIAAAVIKAEPIDTYHAGWNLVRALDDEDGASFAAVYDLTGVGTTNGDFASMSEAVFRIPSRSTGGLGHAPGTKWVFAICGKCYNDVDDTFSFNVVGWAKENGMLHNICEGSGVIGTQAVVTYPEGGDALGEDISVTSGIAYTTADETFTKTAAFKGVVAGMMARVTGTGFTNEIVNITTAGDNAIICDITTTAANCSDATVQINPSFWADTITLDQVTKWSGAVADPNTDNGYYQMTGNIAVLNSGDNEVALLVIDLSGLEYVQFVFYECDGETNEEAGALKVYGRPY